jgi:hypothetical protein
MKDIYFLQIEKIIKKDIQDVLQHVASQTANKLYEIISYEWYDKHNDNGLYYERTYQFLNAITKSDIRNIGDGFEIDIYIDYKDIYPMHASEENQFNKHMSLDNSKNSGDTYAGKNIGEWLIDWIERGQDSPVHSEDGVFMFKKTREWLDKELSSIILYEFSKKGWNIRVG